VTIPTRVVIVNDQELIRCGIRAIVDAQPNLRVVGEASSALEAVSRLSDLEADVVLLDVVKPDLDTVEQVRILAGSGVDDPVPVLLVTSSLGDCCIEALMGGACGLFLKSEGPEELAAALRIAAAGYAVLAPSLTRRLINKLPARHVTASLRRERLAGLSSRERDVLRLLAQGSSNAEIARSLHLGASTVKSHVQRVLRKLGTRDRVQVVVYAYEAGLVQPGGLPTPSLDPPWGQTGSGSEADAALSADSAAV
jgi:DNA-binding NarL/FixJ family response regulator